MTAECVSGSENGREVWSWGFAEETQQQKTQKIWREDALTGDSMAAVYVVSHAEDREV